MSEARLTGADCNIGYQNELHPLWSLAIAGLLRFADVI